jgi:hypothetical protein
MLGLSSHDLSAMRELLGMPNKVLFAAQRGGGLYMNIPAPEPLARFPGSPALSIPGRGLLFGELGAACCVCSQRLTQYIVIL